MPDTAIPPVPACPRCGRSVAPGAAECAGCGVLLAKARERSRRAAEAALPGSPTPDLGRWDAGVAVVVLALVAIGIRGLAPAATVAPVAAADAASPRTSRPGRGGSPGAPRAALQLAEPPARTWSRPPAPWSHAAPSRRDGIALSPSGALTPAQVESLKGLAAVVSRGSEVTADMLLAGEDLHRRHAGDAAVRGVVPGLFFLAAQQAQERGAGAEAARLLERQTELWPDQQEAWSRRIHLQLEVGDPRAAELVARRALQQQPRWLEYHQLLALALIRQARMDEALDALRRCVALGDTVWAAGEARRMERELAEQRVMGQARSAHFVVRHATGSADVPGASRLLVDLLEQKYAMLERILGCEPRGQVVVVLYAPAVFQETNVASGWAGGYYSHADGQIRVSIDSLAAGVDLSLERTLTHELVHAFVAGCAGDAVPRELNEGLAQYLSGARLGYRLARSRAVGWTDGASVRDFYDSALSLAEFLVARGGEARLAEVVKLTESGGTDAAFRRVYGETFAELRAAWRAQLQ